MINPEFQGDITQWTEVKLKETEQPMKSITTFPKLKDFLVKYQWLNKGGNPKWDELAQKLRVELQQSPEKVMYNINVATHQVKLQMPLEDKKRAIFHLKIPSTVKFICSAEHPNLRLAPTDDEVEERSDCSGSLKNYCSSDDVLTEFEIEETVKMVQKWIKKKWYVPSNPNAVIFLESSSDSEASARATKLVVQRLRQPKRSRKQKKPTTPDQTPSKERRQAPKMANYDLFCDDSASESDSATSILF